MMPTTLRSACLISLLSLSLGAPLAAYRNTTVDLVLTPPGAPSGLRPSAATDGGRRFVVVWRSLDGAAQGIAGWRLEANGKGSGAFSVAVRRTGVEVTRPAVAMDSTGRSIVAWGEMGATGCVRVRRILANGQPESSEVQTVSCAPASAAPQAAVAALPGGGFAVAWNEATGSGAPDAVFLRFYDSAGVAMAAPMRAWPRATVAQSTPLLSADTRGELLLAWQQPAAGGSPRLFARHFSSRGVALGAAFEVDTENSLTGRARVSAGAPGRFAAIWEEADDESGDVHGKLLDAGGGLRARLSLPTGSDPFGVGRPDVAMDSHGNLAVAYQGASVEDPERRDGLGVVVRLFNEAGVPKPDRRPVETAGDQSSPAVALAASGSLLLAWQSEIGGGRSEIHARLFAVPGDDELCLYRRNLVICGDRPPLKFGLGVAGGDRPFLADVDGDGRGEACVRRGGSFLCDTAHEGGGAETVLPFGGPGDVPLLGDINGDGRDDPCVRRGAFFLCDTGHDGGAAEFRLRFGLPSDIPLLGDSDGDGDDDPCVFRLAEGGVFCDAKHEAIEDTFLPMDGLQPGDQPFMGDFRGDGFDVPCVRRGRDLYCDLGLDGVLHQIDPRLRAGDVPLLGDVDGF